MATGGCLNVLEGYCDRVSLVAFSPNGEFAASNSYDSTTCIWHATTGVCLQTLENSDSDSHYALVAFPDDKSAILVYPHGRARAWNIATGKCVQTVQIAHSEVELDQLCLSRDGRRAAWASRHKKMIEVVDIIAGQYRETPWHKEIMFGGHRVSVALSSDGECVAAAADCEEHKSNKSYHGCRRIQMWNVATGECIRTLHLSGLKGIMMPLEILSSSIQLEQSGVRHRNGPARIVYWRGPLSRLEFDGLMGLLTRQ